MFFAGAGSVPGRVGFLQTSFVAAELWAHQVLYLALSVVLRSVLSFPRAVALSSDLCAALPLWACIFLAVAPGFDPLQWLSLSLS